VGGIGDIVLEGQTALLANVDDQDGFCRQLLQLVEDDTLRYKLGSNSCPYVMQRFSYQRLMADMTGLYYDLLSRKVTANAVLR
jgi:glycosyltransferase involved in cell wall biosynthesis